MQTPEQRIAAAFEAGFRFAVEIAGLNDENVTELIRDGFEKWTKKQTRQPDPQEPKP